MPFAKLWKRLSPRPAESSSSLIVTAPRRMCGFVSLIPALSGRDINKQPLSTSERQNKSLERTARQRPSQQSCVFPLRVLGSGRAAAQFQR
jgi:hypothetical protein